MDFADMSRMEAWVDGDSSAMSYTGNSGSEDFDLTNTKISIGQEYDDDVFAGFRIRNLQIVPEEIRP